MQDHHEAKDLPGYNPGAPEVARSPITMDELKELKASCLLTDEDTVYLRLSYDVPKDQAEDLVTMWRGIIAQHVHLARYRWDRDSGEPDKQYGERVGKRFAQWVLDTARAEYDQEWLDYQYEIGLRHADGAVRLAAGDAEVTERGVELLAGLDIDLEAVRGHSRRLLFRPCLDWSERRPHLAGVLGFALFDRLLSLGWIVGASAGRAVHVTAAGAPELRAWFGYGPVTC